MMFSLSDILEHGRKSEDLLHEYLFARKYKKYEFQYFYKQAKSAQIVDNLRRHISLAHKIV